MKKDKILITGGAGFAGSHVINLLLEEGHEEITVIDKYEPKIKKDKVKFIMGDFADEKLIVPLLKQHNIMFHFAAMIGVDNCRNNPDLVRKVNYSDTTRLIDLAVENGIERMLFTSSSEVYGNSKEIPYREDGPLEPVSAYGEAKVDVEKYLREVSQNSDMSIGIVRLFNVYGPRQKKDFVVSIFINAALDNKPLLVFGNGDQTRTFTYVKDVARGIYALYKYRNTPYEIVNLGSNQEKSIKDLAQLVLKLLPESDSQIEFQDYGHSGVRTSGYEIDRRVPSVEKAKQLLGFEAKTTLEDGLDATIRYIKEERSND